MKTIKRIILAAVVTLSGVMADDTKPVKGPVKIFLLAGQSNMTGRGTLGNLRKPPEQQKATLVRYIMAPGNKEKYASLTNGSKRTASGWTRRDDVFITMGEWPHLKPGEDGYSNGRKHGGLGPYYGGFRNKGFGPELGIGYVLGNFYDEPVLLVKSSFGANSLGKNFRPPNSGGDVGDKYPLIVKAVRDAVDHLPEIIPAYTEKTGYDIVGFLWNQGVHDMNETFAAEYETNLVNLINDLREEFHAPDMKVVVAVTGNYGWDLADLLKWQKTAEKKAAVTAIWKQVRDAQVAVSKRPEFKHTVGTAETRDFWRPQDTFGGNKQGVHWHANGESYWLIGEAMGREMVNLLKAGG